jgi:hypothetical protein
VAPFVTGSGAAAVVIRHRLDVVEAWMSDIDGDGCSRSPKGSDAVADNEVEPAQLLAFIEAQTKSLKKTGLEEVPALKLSRAVAAVADLTDEAAPDPSSAVFLAAWKRTAQCHHFWGPTVGQERFCTKCQVPRSAVAADEDPGPTRRRS